LPAGGRAEPGLACCRAMQHFRLRPDRRPHKETDEISALFSALFSGSDNAGGATNCASSEFMMPIRNSEAPTKGERSSPEEERAPISASAFLPDYKRRYAI